MNFCSNLQIKLQFKPRGAISSCLCVSWNRVMIFSLNCVCQSPSVVSYFLLVIVWQTTRVAYIVCVMVEPDSGLGQGAVASNILRLIFGHVHDIGTPFLRAQFLFMEQAAWFHGPHRLIFRFHDPWSSSGHQQSPVGGKTQRAA